MKDESISVSVFSSSSVFRRMHIFFLFLISYVLVRKTQLFHFPSSAHTHFTAACTGIKKSFLLHPPATHNQAPLDNRAQLTRNCFSPHSIPSRPKVTPLVKQRKMEKFFPFARDFSMLLSLCASRAQILMTLTLNENEVTINYIKYDISYPLFSCFLFGASRSAHQVYLNVIGKTPLHASQP